MKIHRTHETSWKLNRTLARSTLKVHVPPFQFSFEISGPISNRGRRTILTLVFKRISDLFKNFEDAQIYHSERNLLWELFPARPLSLREMPNLETKLGRTGYALRFRRHRNRLTLRELSEISGVDLHQISDIERGKHSPRKDTLQKIECALARYEEEGVLCLSPSRTSNAQKLPKMWPEQKSAPEQQTPIAALPAPLKTGVRKLDGLAEMWAAQRELERQLAASNVDSET